MRIGLSTYDLIPSKIIPLATELLYQLGSRVLVLWQELHCKHKYSQFSFKKFYN